MCFGHISFQVQNQPAAEVAPLILLVHVAAQVPVQQQRQVHRAHARAQHQPLQHLARFAVGVQLGQQHHVDELRPVKLERADGWVKALNFTNHHLQERWTRPHMRALHHRQCLPEADATLGTRACESIRSRALDGAAAAAAAAR